PICEQDSIVGHGRHRKQAHDEHHDWIGIRRGLCSRCGKTFTFLPPFSPPHGHYSLVARSQALRRYFVEGCCWEAAAPAVKDPDQRLAPRLSTLFKKVTVGGMILVIIDYHKGGWVMPNPKLNKFFTLRIVLVAFCACLVFPLAGQLTRGFISGVVQDSA